jgi:hypothetical protein
LSPAFIMADARQSVMSPGPLNHIGQFSERLVDG